MGVWLYSLASVIIVSLVSLIGVVTLAVRGEVLKKWLLFLVSFSAGALFGDAFIHLLPETVAEAGFGLNVALYVIGGIIVFFVVEKIIRQHKHHMLPKHRHAVRSFAIMNLLGDALHNFIDGLLIGGSYLVSVPVGLATTLAVVLHEIPQEIGDFGVLLRGGFSRGKALLFNFMTALSALLGAVVALMLSAYVKNLTSFLLPVAAGGFIYIAGSDLIPELLHEKQSASGLLALLVAFVLGVAVMASLLAL